MIVKKTLSQAAAPVGIIGAVAGFVGDVLLPLGNFAPWVFGLSLIALIGAVILFSRLYRKQGIEALDSPVGGMLLVAGSATLIFGFWSLAFSFAPDRGFLAENIDPIAQVQASLLGLEEDVQEIKETTTLTATQVVAQSTAQAQGFADLQSALAAIQSGQRVLVDNPTTPQDWYGNARIYQLQGDTLNALKAYEGYFGSQLQFYDPYLEYSALLRATEGIARAREKLAAMRGTDPDNPSLRLAYTVLIEDPDLRLNDLTLFTQQFPAYGPGFYALGQEYDRLLGAGITGDLLEKHSAAYGHLFELEKQSQSFSNFFIDKSAAQKQLSDAEKIVAAYVNANAKIGKVDVLVTQTGLNAIFIVVLSEADVQDLLYSFDQPNPDRSTGKIPNMEQFVNSTIGPLVVPVGEHTIYVKYIDKNGFESQVFSKDFKIEPVVVIFSGNPPDFSTGKVSGNLIFQVYAVEGGDYIYRYSIDSEALDQEVRSIHVGTAEVKDLAPGDHTVYVQATPVGGEALPLVRFDFTVK